MDLAAGPNRVELGERPGLTVDGGMAVASAAGPRYG
jgi:hypothetical protein